MNSQLVKDINVDTSSTRSGRTNVTRNVTPESFFSEPNTIPSPWESKLHVCRFLNPKATKAVTMNHTIWISSHRQSILTFARECRADIHHDAEEWNHILSLANEYEVYCSTHAVSNGVVKADTRYVRDLYQELSREHKI